MTKTVALLPGNMCDARLWRGGDGILIDTLESRGLDNIHDADLTQDSTIAAMASRTLASTQGSLVAVGFSMGAIVAVEMWCQDPQRINCLVLLGYNATADLSDRAALRPVQQAEVCSGGLERVLVEELKPNYLGTVRRADIALRDLLRDMGMALGPDVFVRQSEALRLRADRRAALSTITVPVLFGCGGEDALCPPAWHAEWATRIGDANNFTVDGAGHMLPLEAPVALADHLNRWLTEKELA